MKYDVLLKKSSPLFETLNDLVLMMAKIGKINFDKEENENEVKYEFAKEFTSEEIKEMLKY